MVAADRNHLRPNGKVKPRTPAHAQQAGGNVFFRWRDLYGDSLPTVVHEVQAGSQAPVSKAPTPLGRSAEVLVKLLWVNKVVSWVMHENPEERTCNFHYFAAANVFKTATVFLGLRA